MKNPLFYGKSYATFSICVAILLCWCIVAFHSGQQLYGTQRGQMLLGYGAVNGELLRHGGHWRIIASQFMHVNFAHMLGNVLFILLIGAYVERRCGSCALLLVYFVGGTMGQYASVLFNPGLVSSGASQALCAIAGCSAIMLLREWRSSRVTLAIVLLFMPVQMSLDVCFAQRLKEGHIFGFLAGAAMSSYFVWKAIKTRPKNQ